MRPHWNRNHTRSAEAANDRLRQRYEHRRENLGISPVAVVPDKLKRAMRRPRWSGEPVLVTAGGRDVAAVLGTESTDAWAIWRDITAAVQAGAGPVDAGAAGGGAVDAGPVGAGAVGAGPVGAGSAGEDIGAGVRLIPPAPFAEGLRAVAVPSERQVVVWRSSAESVTNRQRRIAARRALRALDGHQVPPAVWLSLLMPGWRKAVPIAAVAASAVVVAVLISTGQIWHHSRGPSSPAVAATGQPTAGAARGSAPTAPSSDPVGRRRSGRLGAGGHAPSRHRSTGAHPAGPASSSARASATQAQPSPTRASSSSSPSPSPTGQQKNCKLVVLGVCVSR